MNYGGAFDFDIKFEKLEQITLELEDPCIWNNPKRAQRLNKEKKSLENIVHVITQINCDLTDIKDLFIMAREEKDINTLIAIEVNLENLKQIISNIEFRQMFKYSIDSHNCFIDIQAGAGGTEAQDWASMLLRQYLRYCERKKFKTEILEQSDGEVAGIKTATIKVKGEYAYGFLRTETGVHRLVRKSPFDSNNNRHTSFCSLFVYPEVDDSIEIKINVADVRTDTYRASGAGGQHINKTDSAIRLTHIPSGIVVQCQSDRSQHRNRAEAWDMLKAKLYELELRKRMIEYKKLEDSKSDVAWGYQIRSYILDQSRIKDLRTKYEINNIKAVLDGDLDDFILASLKQGM